MLLLYDSMITLEKSTFQWSSSDLGLPGGDHNLGTGMSDISLETAMCAVSNGMAYIPVLHS